MRVKKSALQSIHLLRLPKKKKKKKRESQRVGSLLPLESARAELAERYLHQGRHYMASTAHALPKRQPYKIGDALSETYRKVHLGGHHE